MDNAEGNNTLANRLSPADVTRIIGEIEQHLKVPDGSVSKLFGPEDDWSTIIKLHALIEGAVTLLLCSVLDDRLQPVLSILELGRDQVGKLEFTKVLDVTTPGQRKFVRALSLLRNKLAHDARYIGFELKSHIASLDKGQRKAFFDAVSFDIEPENVEKWKALIAEQPRAAVVASGLRLILRIMEHTSIAKRDRALDKIHVDYAKAMLDALEEEEEKEDPGK